MKIFFNIIFALLIVSCGTGATPQAISTADSLMEDNPDSALSVLNNAAKDFNGYSKKQQMRYLLLKAIAMNKAYIDMDTLKFVDNIFEYYKNHGTPNEKMMAYYMKGCVYRDKKDSPNALQYYLDAVNCVDTADAECDKMNLCRIYGQIASLYHEQNVPRREITIWRKASEIASKAGDTLSSIQYKDRIGFAYESLGIHDTAHMYYINIYKEYLAHGYRSQAAACLIYQYAEEIRNKNFKSAQKHIDEYRKYSELFEKNGEIKPSHEVCYYFFGEYFRGIERYDSAQFYFRKLMSYKYDISNIENGAKGLMFVYQNLHNPDSVTKYANICVNMNDSANVIASGKEIIRTQALYDYTESQKLSVEKTKENYLLKTALWMVFFIVAISGWSLYKFYIQRRKKLQKDYEDILCQYKNIKNDIIECQKDKECFIEEKEKEIESLKKVISTYRESQNAKEWNDEQKALEHEFVSLLHKHAIKGLKMSGMDWKKLNKITEFFMHDFIMKLDAIRDNLTQIEANVFLLTRLHFTPSEIGNLLELSPQRISNIRSCINKKIFKKNGTKSVDYHIETF